MLVRTLWAAWAFLTVSATTVPSYTLAASCKAPASLSSLNNATFYSLGQTFAPALQPQDPTALEQIRNTIALYSPIIDGKNFDLLNLVFTQDAVANYSEPLNILTPLSNIITVLRASLNYTNTQHSMTTQVINLSQDGCSARALTYLRAVHFGRGTYYGQTVESYAQYRDVLMKTADGWRIRERTLAYMGPLVGNVDIFLPQNTTGQ